MVKLSENLVLARSRASDLESVRKLNCWGSELDNITVLRQMPNVEVVSLSVNNISSLEDFSQCVNLQELYIRKNNISNLAEICHLKRLPKLRILWLSDNPCAVGDRYRMTVLKTLPNLQKLDNIQVTEEERHEAIERGIEVKCLTTHIPTDSASNSKNSSVTPEERNDAIEMGADLVHPPTSSSSSSVDQDELNEALEEGIDLKPPPGGDSPAKQTRPKISPTKPKTPVKDEDPATLTLEETNNIRAQLGLKPLPSDKMSPIKPKLGGNKHRNANLLQAVLCLVKELDADSLEIVGNAVKNRLESM